MKHGCGEKGIKGSTMNPSFDIPKRLKKSRLGLALWFAGDGDEKKKKNWFWCSGFVGEGDEEKIIGFDVLG